MTRLTDLRQRYKALCARNLNLDLTRGNPSMEQLNLSNEMLRYQSYKSRDGIDCRNYGPPEFIGGLPEARELFGEYLGVSAQNCFVLDNSSLRLMYDLVRWYKDYQNYQHGAYMLCPAPGYDRHFAICKALTIGMQGVALGEDGPDMDEVEKYAQDEKYIGIWCTPKYSNPTGITYSQEVCERLARMKTKGKFRIFWDLAYNGHHLTEQSDELPDMLTLCREAGHEDRVFIFGSTSKITFAGAGLALFAASEPNLSWLERHLRAQTIGPNKLNQLHHIAFLRDAAGIARHMKKHRDILRPKFDVVEQILSRDLGGKGIARWTSPRGGYFVSVWMTPGCAQKVVWLMANAGIKLTPSGAAFPYEDPEDSHLRIAPTYPMFAELRQAMNALTLCIELATLEHAT